MALTTRRLKKGDKIRLTGLCILRDGPERRDRHSHQDRGQQEKQAV
jgi:hypothetical protein